MPSSRWLFQFPTGKSIICSRNPKRRKYLEALDENVLAALIFTPLIGAGFCALSRHSRIVAMAAGGITSLLAVLCGWRFLAGAELDVLLEWVRIGMGVDLSLEASGASVGGAVALLCIWWLAWMLWRPIRPDRKGYYALILLLLGLGTATLLAGDLLLLLSLVPLTIFSGMMLTAIWGARRASRIDIRPFGGMYVGWLVLLAAGMHLGWVHYRQTGLMSFSLHDLIGFFPASRTEPDLWILLALGTLGTWALGPMGWLFYRRDWPLPAGANLLWICQTRVVGMVLFVRVLLPLRPDITFDLALWSLLALGGATVLLILWSLATSRNRSRAYLPLLPVMVWETALLCWGLMAGPEVGSWILLLTGVEVVGIALLLTLTHRPEASASGEIRRPNGAIFAVLLVAILPALGLLTRMGPMIPERGQPEIPTRPAFSLDARPQAGILSAMGIVLWAVGLFWMRPFGRSRGKGNHELLARTWGQSIVQVGVGLFLLDGVGRLHGHSAGAYIRAAWISDPLRIAVMLGLHSGLILLLTGSAVWLLVLRGKSVRRLESSCGLARSCPGEAWVLMIAGLSLLGAAPLGGYWQLCLLFGLRGSWHSQALLALPLLFVLPVTAMSVMDLCGRMFDTPEDPEPSPGQASGAPAMALRMIIVVLIIALLLLGLVPQLFLEPVGWLGG